MSEATQAKPEVKALKSTLNLPQTTFPMKANLPQNEPARLEAWQKQDLYAQIRTARASQPKYILHDGPPYANGAIHLGHALNKCIKDFVVKTKTMAGFDAPYVPGWDCHGLPIEIKVDEQLGRKKLEMPSIAVRRACREYAQKYVDLQRTQFERIGVFGRWNDPYLTMSLNYEASIVETFYDFFEKDFVYKGLKPVYWCIHDRTALAEAEVEYEQHTSPSVYIRYALTSDPAAIHPALAGRKVYTIIWTTTPWTIPASQAVAFNPHLEYVAVQSVEATYLVAEALLSSVIVNCNLMSGKNPAEPASQTDIVAAFPGSKLEHATFQHPFLHRSILGVTADYVTAEQGTGAVHTSPAHGVDDFFTGQRYRLPELQYVDNAGKQRHTADASSHNVTQPYEDLTVFKSNPVIIELLKERGALLSATNFEHSYPHCWRCHNPVIVRATEQWFIGMETPMTTENGNDTTFRQRALDEIKQVVWDPAWGEERISNMIATRPDWCISRQRIWGVPIAVFLCDRCGEPLKDKSVNQSIVDLFKKEGADAWYIHEAATLLPSTAACAGCGHKDFRKEMDILDVWFESGARQSPLQDGRHLRLDPRRTRPRLFKEPGKWGGSCGYCQAPRWRNHPSLGRLRRLPRRRSGQRKPHAACQRQLS
jgi:isoleucyl-tRNA synthetase